MASSAVQILCPYRSCQLLEITLILLFTLASWARVVSRRPLIRKSFARGMDAEGQQGGKRVCYGRRS